MLQKATIQSDTEILICYVSSATREFSKGDPFELLTKSRTSNSTLGLTGVLLHRGGIFLQVLEGPPDLVEPKFEKSTTDPRHRGVIKLLHRRITERAFSDWSMGFRELQADEARCLEEASEKDENLPNYVEKLIETFRQINR